MFEVAEEILNPGAEPLEVWFEPWGMPHSLLPGRSFHILASSEEPGQLEVRHESSRVAVYGWPGCTMRVSCGEELVDDLTVKFPALPPGLSIRSFVEDLFGGPGGPVR